MNKEDYEHVSKEHAIVIMNHKYDVDWLMGWIVCQRAGLLAGSKIIGKATLKLIPLIGWCWLATESIFIERQWETDKKKLVEGLDKILCDYPDNYYFNVLMFCEGTRFTQAKHDASMKVAREKGLPELKHHLLPRTKGFSLLNRGAAGRINAIYDLTIGIAETDGKKPDLNSMRNGVPFKGEIYARRIPMSEVPEGDAESAEFVHKLYREKDEIFDVYKKEGTFKSLGEPIILRPHNYMDLYISLTWCFLLVTPLVYYLVIFFQSASLFSISIFLAIGFLTSITSDFFIRLSSSEKGSKYGKTDTKKSD